MIWDGQPNKRDSWKCGYFTAYSCGNTLWRGFGIFAFFSIALVCFCCCFANLGREIIKDCEDMESDFNETLPKIVGLEKARMVMSLLISGTVVHSSLERASFLRASSFTNSCDSNVDHFECSTHER